LKINKKDALITIKSVHIVDEDKDVSEIVTVGKFYKHNGEYVISYEESEATGFDGTLTTVSVQGAEKVEMNRRGSTNSQLIVQKGARHQCQYDTGFGNVTIGVLGDTIENSLTDDGGELAFRYSIDINTSLTSINIIYISVKLQNTEKSA